MNENDRQPPETSSTETQQGQPGPEMAVTLGDGESRKAPDAPLVDVALDEVSRRDDSIGTSLSDDLAAMQGEIDSLSARVGEASSNALVSVQSGARTTARSARRAVRQSPWMAVGIAATFGYLLGLSAWR